MSTNSSSNPSTSLTTVTSTPITQFIGTPVSHVKTVHHAYGVATLLLCIATLLGDVLLLFYFLTKKRRPSTLVFYCLLVCDAILAVTGMFIAIDLLVYQTDEWTILNNKTKDTWHYIVDNLVVDSGLARQVNSYFYGVASRMSCMINCYLSVVRAIVITFPFTNINPRLLLGSLFGYLLLVIVVLIVAFVKQDGGFCTHLWMVCEAEYFSTIYDALIFTGIPYVLPCVPVVVSCGVIAYKQLTSKQFGDTAKQMREGTITILYVSLLFVVCNSAYLIFSFIEYDYIYTKQMDGHPQYSDLAEYYGLRTFTTFLNIGGNALILLLRSSGVKEFCGKIFRREISVLDLIRPAKAKRATQSATAMSRLESTRVGSPSSFSVAPASTRRCMLTLQKVGEDEVPEKVQGKVHEDSFEIESGGEGGDVAANEGAL